LYNARVKALLYVALGGALGSLARYGLGGWVLHHTANLRLPLGILAVNVAGCLVAGIAAGLVTKHDLLASDLRVFLFAGMLGGFTTFSAFGIETLTLVRKGDVTMAATYVFLSVVLSLAAVFAGFFATHR
jgi:CrcB protein